MEPISINTPEISMMLTKEVNKHSRFASLRNLTTDKAHNSNNLLVDSKRDINEYVLSPYAYSYDSNIYDLLFPFNNPYDQSIKYDRQFNDRHIIVYLYKQYQVYELFDSLRPTLSLQIAHDTIPTMITVMNCFMEFIYSMLGSAIHASLSLEDDDIVSLYKLYERKNDSGNQLAYLPFYTFPFYIKCPNKAHDLPTMIKVCIAPTIKKLIMYIIENKDLSSRCRDSSFQPVVNRVFNHNVHIAQYVYEYNDDEDCADKVNQMVQAYIKILRYTCGVNPETEIPYSVWKDYDSPFATCAIYNLTNHLHGNIKRSGAYQYSITFDAEGSYIRTINRLNAITTINRIINRSRFVKEALDKAHRFAQDNNIEEQEEQYSKLLAQRYNSTLANTIESILEQMFTIAIQNVSSEYVAKTRYMKVNVDIPYETIKARSIVCDIGLYYMSADPTNTLTLRIYDIGKSESTKVKAIDNTMKSLALCKDYDLLFASIGYIAKEIKTIEDVAEVYRKIDSKFKVRAHRYIKTGIIDLLNYIKNNPDSFRDLFVELVTAYHNFNVLLDNDVVVASKKLEVAELHKQKNAIMKNDVHFQKQQQINNLTIDMIDSNVGTFLTQFNYYCDSELCGAYIGSY